MSLSGIDRVDHAGKWRVEVDGPFCVVPAVVILHRLDDIGEIAQRRDVGGSGHAMQHALARGTMRQPEEFEIETDGVHPRYTSKRRR